MLSFIAPIDSKLSGSQLQFLRILKNTILKSEDLDITSIILLELSEKIHPYIAMELHDLVKIVKRLPHSSCEIKTIKTTHGPSLELASKLAIYNKLFIGSGDLTDYFTASVVQAITRRHIRRGILLGNVITGLALHIALYNMKHAIHVLKKLRLRNSIDVNTRACLLHLTKCLKVYDLVVTPGVSLAKVLKHFNLKSKVMPFRNPTIPVRFEYPKLLKTTDKITIGFISRYFPGKGLTQVIEAVNKLKHKKKINLIIVGVDKNSISWKLKEFHKIKIYKSLDPISLTRVLREVDILLYPSLIDSWAHVIPESLAVGTPVITFNIEPFRSNFKYCKAVIKVSLTNSSGFASKLENLIENPNLFNELKCQAYEYALKEFNPDEVVKEFTKILKLLIELE